MSSTTSPAAESSAGDSTRSPEAPALERILFPPQSRDRSIPIYTGDLTRLLMAEPGLTDEDRLQFSQFVRVIASVFHYEYFSWLNELKELYSPIDPDRDCVRLEGFTRNQDEQSDETFLGPFEDTLVRANYRRLEFNLLEDAIAAPNELGLNYIPDLKLFEHLRVYVRGYAKIPRVIRHIKNFYRKSEMTHDAYRRVVIVLKFKEGADLGDGDYARTDRVYLRLFRDVPYVEMDMHLPEQGTKVQMRWIDKFQIASPLFVGLPTLALKVFALSALSPWIAGSLLVGPVSAGVKSFFGFHRAKQKYLHKMIRHLYYLTLANNSSVINRLIDSAEEEEFKEAVLAYFFLWRGRNDPDRWTQGRLDAEIEGYLRAKTNLDIDFEVDDALAKLVRLGLVHNEPGDRLRAVPIDQALAILDEQWDHYFQFR